MIVANMDTNADHARCLEMGRCSVYKMIIILVMATICSGCQCFKVCPTVPKPAKLEPLPEVCYKSLRSTDPVDVILKCYITDIVRLEEAAVKREEALKAYR